MLVLEVVRQVSDLTEEELFGRIVEDSRRVEEGMIIEVDNVGGCELKVVELDVVENGELDVHGEVELGGVKVTERRIGELEDNVDGVMGDPEGS